MSNGNYRQNGSRPLRRWANLFAVTNAEELAIKYRLLEIRGVPSHQHFDENVNKLVKAVGYEIRQPVALVRLGSTYHLAIPADAPLPKLEQPLTPHIATLIPLDQVHSLEFANLSRQTARIAERFLEFAFRTPLMHDRELWGSVGLWYSKQTANADDPHAQADLYRGFGWDVIIRDDGRLFLCVDLAARYIDRKRLHERLSESGIDAYRGRRCLYHFGHRWYMVQICGLTDNSICEQRFQPNGQERVSDVLSYTRERCGRDVPPWVCDLDPASPAIIYRYPGNAVDRYGALGLCKLALATDDPSVSGLHRRAIIGPAARLQRIRAVVDGPFQQARLGDKPVRVADTPLEIERRIFPVPSQLFGNGRVLAIGAGDRMQSTATVPLDQLGRERLRLLLDPEAGPVDKSPFVQQYLLLPQSLPRGINEDFDRRFQHAMQKVSGRQDYRAQRILYDDRGASSLFRQVSAIKAAVATAQLQSGYVFLVLPEKAHRDLHNSIKRELWPHWQLQCAMARKIRSYYEDQAGSSAPQPAKHRVRRLDSYVRNCALGMMVTNRRWAWKLAAPLHYDVNIGIDVLNGIAGLTFVYNHGERIWFQDYRCQQKERLTTAQLRQILARDLRDHLQELKLCPRSIVIHRDGRTFRSELQGIQQAVEELKEVKVLPPDVVVGVLNVRKTSVARVRLFEGEFLEAVENPTIGSPLVLGPRAGFVATTGRPFQFPGTADPLGVTIVAGQLDIHRVLEDIFALSQLAFTAPDKCVRLPATIKLADAFLEPIAGKVDEEEVLYEVNPEDGLESTDDVGLPVTDAGWPGT